MYATVFALFSCISVPSIGCNLELELTMNVTEEIEYNGYPAENYKVETPDGYILQVQRIPRGKNSSTNPYPILVIHGIGCDASSYVDKLENSLPFHLADNGFDVWLGNVRGNKYSLQHKTLTPDHSQFWDYSLDDIASKDLPAMLNLIMNVTRKDKLFYAGTSLGSVVGIMLLSSQPQWNDKIKGFLDILPVSRVTYTTWPLRPFLESLLKLDLPEAMFSTPFMNVYFPTKWMYEPSFRLFDMYLYLGYDPETSLPFEREELAFDQELHYYNYGPSINMQHYNSSSPPIYNMSKITTAVALFTGENDATADPLDVAAFIKDLPNVYSVYVHPYVMFSHHDMTRAKATMRTFVTEIAQAGLKMAKHLL